MFVLLGSSTSSQVSFFSSAASSVLIAFSHSGQTEPCFASLSDPGSPGCKCAMYVSRYSSWSLYIEYLISISFIWAMAAVSFLFLFIYLFFQFIVLLGRTL